VKFKIDENLPVEIAGLLRVAGYDAITVIEQELRGGRMTLLSVRPAYRRGESCRG
jgi:hypothetical protein